MILSIDPGLRACGFAIYHKGPLPRLHKAGLVKNTKTGTAFNMAKAVCDHVRSKVELPFSEHISEVVIEKPQVYVAAKLKGDPNDLITIAVVVGAIGFAYARQEATVTVYLPREWKGNCPKEVTQQRAKNRLTSEEMDRIEMPAMSLAHNVWDAIALGLFYTGRGK